MLYFLYLVYIFLVYFEEQLARIKDIRSSERRFYQKITDIYSQCSADYTKDSEITKQFFATIQNKLHWAITHQTAAEIIHSRADSQKDNMGLTTWKNSPSGQIRKTDVSVAKNYLCTDIILQVAVIDSLDGTHRAYGHENRGFNPSVVGFYHSAPCRCTTFILRL